MIKDNEEYFYPYLTLKYGITSVKASLVWTEEALQDLRQKDSQVREPVDLKPSREVGHGEL